MCGQFEMFPAEPDPGQPHTEPGSCLTHLGACCLCMCVYVRRMNVSDYD